MRSAIFRNPRTQDRVVCGAREHELCHRALRQDETVRRLHSARILISRYSRQSLQHHSERAAKFRSASYVQKASAVPVSTEVYISNIAAPLALLLGEQPHRGSNSLLMLSRLCAGLALNLYYFKGSVTSILFLSPILLLLNQVAVPLASCSHSRGLLCRTMVCCLI